MRSQGSTQDNTSNAPWRLRRGSLAVAVASLTAVVLLTGMASAAAWNKNATGTANGKAGSLGAPSSPSANSTGATPTSENVTWAAPVGGAPTGLAPTSYTVTRSSGTVAGSCAGTLPAGTTSCTDTGVAANTAYTWTITATRDTWNSGGATSGSATTLPKGSPTLALGNPTPTSGAAGSAFQATATISGGYTPTGNVSFSLYTTNTCATIVSGTTVTNALSGTASTGSISPANAGTYFFGASYVGDANNNSTAVTCNTTAITVTSSPTVTLTFPVTGKTYSITGSNGNPGTWKGDSSACPSNEEMCGTSSDTGSTITTVEISILAPNGKYWNGTLTGGSANFVNTAVTWNTVTGTTAWSQAWAHTVFHNVLGSYTVQVRAHDSAGSTSGVVSATFTTST